MKNKKLVTIYNTVANRYETGYYIGLRFVIVSTASVKFN